MELSSSGNQNESEFDNENTTSLITPSPSTIPPMELKKSSIGKLLANDNDDKTVTDTSTNDPSINTEKKDKEQDQQNTVNAATNLLNLHNNNSINNPYIDDNILPIDPVQYKMHEEQENILFSNSDASNYSSYPGNKHSFKKLLPFIELVVKYELLNEKCIAIHLSDVINEETDSFAVQDLMNNGINIYLLYMKTPTDEIFINDVSYNHGFRLAEVFLSKIFYTSTDRRGISQVMKDKDT